MIIFVLFGFVSSVMLNDEQQLTQAACVIFSRYYINSKQEQAAQAVQKMESNGLNREEAIQAMQAACVDTCLNKITQQETFGIMQGLQTQQLKLEDYGHLLMGVSFEKFGTKKANSKKTEALKVIKGIDQLIEQQKQEHEANGGQAPQQDEDRPSGVKGRKNNKKSSSDKKSFTDDIPTLFSFQETLILLSFAFVAFLLIYLTCFVPDKQPKTKTKKVKVEDN
ncbi:hypothetical protein pb186bvf_016276 [Paramecium bursaria]